MNFYNNIFASSYIFYSKQKNGTPLFTSICLVVACQMLFLFFLIILFKTLDIIDIFGMLPSKYYFLPVLLIWFIILIKYYSKEKVRAIMISFEEKTMWEKKFWGILTLISLIVPVITIALLLKK